MPLISVQKSLNGAEFLNATCVAALSGLFPWTRSYRAVAIGPVTTIFPVTWIYASE